MLNVFAIDPEIIRDGEQFRYCTQHCHPSNGRLIADLPPGLWSVMTYEIIKELGLRSKEEKKLKRRLHRVVEEQLIERLGTKWDFLESSWITNAENEHRRDPFSLIISPDYDEADDKELKYPPSELDHEVNTWNTPTGTEITRSPKDFVKAILPMLLLAEEIHFVDRFFNVLDDSLHTKSYKKIIEELAKYYNLFSSFPSLIIHCCPKVEEDYENYLYNFKFGLNEHYAPLIPTGKSIKAFLWENKIEKGVSHPFHNRFVLSNHCGVLVGYGTDEDKQKTSAPDHLQIVDERMYKNLWERIRKAEWPGAEIKKRFEIKKCGISG